MLAINTLDADGRPQFIHSGTYEELIAAFGLTGAALTPRQRAIGPIQRTELSPMSVPTRHESDVEALDLPGRHLQWLVVERRHPGRALFDLRIRVAPGEKVTPRTRIRTAKK